VFHHLSFLCSLISLSKSTFLSSLLVLLFNYSYLHLCFFFSSSLLFIPSSVSLSLSLSVCLSLSLSFSLSLLFVCVCVCVCVLGNMSQIISKLNTSPLKKDQEAERGREVIRGSWSTRESHGKACWHFSQLPTFTWDLVSFTEKGIHLFGDHVVEVENSQTYPVLFKVSLGE